MPLNRDLLTTVTNGSSQEAWAAITDRLWADFSASIPPAVADAEVVKRDRGLTELDNVLSGAAWDLWFHFENAVPKVSSAIVDFWNKTQGGKAVFILDGVSLREVPWLLDGAKSHGFKVLGTGVCGAELPAETTEFAKSLGFSQRSSLENNGAGSAHKLKGAYTVSCNLPWKDCLDLVGSHEAIVFWHHWPDERLHYLSGPGAGLGKLAKETHSVLASDDFWAFLERLATGRQVFITSDHGYAATGLFPDMNDKGQVSHMKSLFKNGRSAPDNSHESSWVPPIDLKLETAHGIHRYVLGRRKWKSAAGYPTLQHGGLSLLEVLVPFILLS